MRGWLKWPGIEYKWPGGQDELDQAEHSCEGGFRWSE
jgi:hypothetical protein